MSAEACILGMLDAAPTATHWFAKRCGITGPQARRLLWRLARQGKALPVEDGAGRARWWAKP